MSVRPMRPPAPAITTRMSAIALSPVCAGISELRAVVAFDDSEVENALAVAQLLRRLIAGRMVTGERGVVAREFQHHDAFARFPLRRFALAAAHQIAGAERTERRLVGGHVGLV